jgi:hypothetical protein
MLYMLVNRSIGADVTSNTAAFTDYVLNNSSQIAVGPSNNQRSFSTITFDDLSVNLIVTIPNGLVVRYIVLTCVSPVMAQDTTSSQLLIDYTNAFVNNSPTANDSGYSLSGLFGPFTTQADFRLYDEQWLGYDIPVTSDSTPTTVTINDSYALGLVRNYDYTGVPTSGSFLVLLTASTTQSVMPTVTGTMTLTYHSGLEIPENEF